MRFAVFFAATGFAFAAPLPKELRGNDQSRIQGKWKVVQRLDNGTPRNFANERCFWVFNDEKMTIDDRSGYTFKLNFDESPKHLDLTVGNNGGNHYLGIYELDGDKLTWHNTGTNGKRPTKMADPGNTIIFERVKE